MTSLNLNGTDEMTITKNKNKQLIKSVVRRANWIKQIKLKVSITLKQDFMHSYRLIKSNLDL